MVNMMWFKCFICNKKNQNPVFNGEEKYCIECFEKWIEDWKKCKERMCYLECDDLGCNDTCILITRVIKEMEIK